MGFEPQKFFIGLMDFFSILMPGSMLVYLGKDWTAVKFGLENGYPLDTTESGAVFFFASYLLGHFIFLVSSTLDDLVYDPVRKWTDWGQIGRLAAGKTLTPRRLRALATSSLFFDKNADNAVIPALRIKARALNALEAVDAINAFQWCKARLIKDSPEGSILVQRFEADSKFFRSFVVVLGILTVFYASLCMWLAAIVSFAGIAPALWRYMDQRFKATQNAYWLVITQTPGAATRVPRADGLTHAGGVVYKTEGGVTTFLLVQANSARDQWVLPKGHIEAGEVLQVTAVREVKEESGHWVSVVHWLADAPLNSDAGASKVRWFVMKLAEEGKQWPKENRQYDWLSLTDATNRATFPETRALLAKAAEQLR